MIDFCRGYQNVIIYGAGAVAQRTSRLLSKAGIDIDCYVVSDEAHMNKLNSINNIPVMSLSDWIKMRDTTKKYGILVAVSERYHNEISEMLTVHDLKNVFFASEKDLQKVCRELYPISASKFLNTVEPVSRLFGTDRGTPIDRYYIEKFLRQEALEMQSSKSTLEVAEDTYSKKFFPDAVHDILKYDEGMDLTDVDTLPENIYDVFICTQVLHVIFDLRSAIKGTYRLLTPGGTLLATVAGNISQVAEYDMSQWGYYWGFTGIAIQKLMEETFGPGNVETFSYGNIMAATAFIQGVALEDLPDVTLLDEMDSAYSICIGIRARKC